MLTTRGFPATKKGAAALGGRRRSAIGVGKDVEDGAERSERSERSERKDGDEGGDKMEKWRKDIPCRASQREGWGVHIPLHIIGRVASTQPIARASANQPASATRTLHRITRKLLLHLSV